MKKPQAKELLKEWRKDIARDTIRELQMDEQRLRERCPHIITKQAGDETYDICELNTKSCLEEHGLYECDTWEAIKREEIKK